MTETPERVTQQETLECMESNLAYHKSKVTFLELRIEADKAGLDFETFMIKRHEDFIKEMTK